MSRGSARDYILSVLDDLNEADMHELARNVYYWKKQREEKKQTDEGIKQRAFAEFDYLEGLSIDTKRFIMERVDSGNTNLYHSIMATIGRLVAEGKTSRECYDYYMKRRQHKNALIGHEEKVKETVNLCYEKLKEKRKMKGR